MKKTCGTCRKLTANGKYIATSNGQKRWICLACAAKRAQARSGR